MVAPVDDHHHRHLVHLNEFSQRFRDVGRDAAGGVACFGVHAQDVAPLQHLADGLDQMQVHGKLSGADGTDKFHKPRTAIVAVDGHHVVDPMGQGTHGTQFKIDEVHMIAQQKIRRL